MKIKELIEALQNFDDEAEVYIGNQPHYPFENSICGVVARDEFTTSSDFEDEPKGNMNDVFILEGSQVRYGSRKMWEV